jgi:hypothetical protein
VGKKMIDFVVEFAVRFVFLVLCLIVAGILVNLTPGIPDEIAGVGLGMYNMLTGSITKGFKV